MTATDINAESWRSNLITTKSGAAKPLLANAITALRDAPAWQDVVAYDEFAMQTIMDGAPPWEMHPELHQSRAWTPHDDCLATEWFQRREIPVNTATAAQAVETVARDRSFHPVQDYLAGIAYDGEPRLYNWLSAYLGADQNPFIEAAGRSMMIAAVARICDPGCKVDTVPILEGAQGARKSTAVRTLFDPWFTDELDDLGSKDAAMQTRGVWGIEVSELDAMSRMEVSRIKAFISRTTDRFRPPYGNRIIESRRSCVFWGTTNSDGYLKDETGGRRFWPIKIGKIDVDGLAEVRDQLWGEAFALYQAGVAWWIVNPHVQRDAEDQQRNRYAGDPWDETIAQYVATALNDEVAIADVLTRGIGLEISRCGQPEMNRAARVLRSMGLVRVQRGSGATKRWVYRKPVPAVVLPLRQPTGTTLETGAGPLLVPQEMPAAQAWAPVSPVSSVRS